MPAGFVRREGRKLFIDDQEWRFVGTNDPSLTGCHHNFWPDLGGIRQFFDQFKDNGNILVRTWAFQHLGPQATILQQLDDVVSVAESTGTKLALVLHEGAEYCGAPDYDLAWYQTGYQSTLLPWVDTVVARYKSSPAIGFWEISNEPGTKAPGMDIPTIKGFLDGVAARIKANDPYHLVGSGVLATGYGFVGSGTGYQTIHSGPDIDLLSMHEYDYGYTQGSVAVSPWWARGADAAFNLGKVAYVGEMGVSKSSGTTAEQRGVDTGRKLDSYFAPSVTGLPIGQPPESRLPGGVLYWSTMFPPNDAGDSDKGAATNDPNIGGTIIPTLVGYAHPNLPVYVPPEPVDPPEPPGPSNPPYVPPFPRSKWQRSKWQRPGWLRCLPPWHRR